MIWLAGILFAVLIAGPLRRPFFRQWRFNIPAFLAGACSFVVVYRATGPYDPWWMPYAVAPLVALGAGVAVKEWLDGVFGKEK